MKKETSATSKRTKKIATVIGGAAAVTTLLISGASHFSTLVPYVKTPIEKK